MGTIAPLIVELASNHGSYVASVILFVALGGIIRSYRGKNNIPDGRVLDPGCVTQDIMSGAAVLPFIFILISSFIEELRPVVMNDQIIIIYVSAFLGLFHCLNAFWNPSVVVRVNGNGDKTAD